MKLEVDGTEVDTAAYGNTLETRTEALQLGGNTVATQSGLAFRSDCMVLFDRYLTDAEISNLWTRYDLELEA
jgi:hypothetical protein